MNFKPKSVFEKRNEKAIAIDMSVNFEKFVFALRFWFDGVNRGLGGSAEDAFKKGMARAISEYVHENGGGFDILPSEVSCSMVCLDRLNFEKRLGEETLLVFEKESEKAMAEYFFDNREIGDIVVEKIVAFHLDKR